MFPQAAWALRFVDCLKEGKLAPVALPEQQYGSVDEEQ